MSVVATVGALVVLVVPLYIGLYQIGERLGRLESDHQTNQKTVDDIQVTVDEIEYVLRTDDDIDYTKTVGLNSD